MCGTVLELLVEDEVMGRICTVVKYHTDVLLVVLCLSFCQLVNICVLLVCLSFSDLGQMLPIR